MKTSEGAKQASQDWSKQKTEEEAREMQL